MEQRPEQPPEGRLIAAATKRMDLSIREAARRAGISYGRWRQITSGVQNVSPGSYAAVHAPARTLAKMARVVGVTPEQLETEGQRPDAAEYMRGQYAEPVTSSGGLRLSPREPGPAAAGTPAPEGRTSLFDSLPRPLAAQVRPRYDAIIGRVKVAGATHPGVTLEGRQVYPDSPAMARRWDVIAERGYAVYGDEGFTSKEIAEGLALALFLDERQAEPGGELASGLTA